MPRQAAKTRPAEEATAVTEDSTLPGAAPAESNSRRRRLAEQAPAKGGWGAYKTQKASRSGFAQNFKVDEGGEKLIRFIGDSPFFSYYRHWLRDIKGRQTFACLDEDCPLCDIGDTPAFVAMFNVIDMSDRANPAVRLWEASPQPAGAIEELSEDPRTSPIDKPGLYFSVTKKKQSNGFNAFKLTRILARDFEDEYPGTEPLTEEELAELVKDAYDETAVKVDTAEFLRDVVKGMQGGE